MQTSESSTPTAVSKGKQTAMIVVIILAAIVAGLLGLASTKPNSFRYERSATIKASPAKIFALIDNFRSWAQWSPYDKLDPAMTKTYSGPESGDGAVYEWSSAGKAGTGRMEITKAETPTKVTIKLDFLKPFEGHNTAEFTLVPHGDTTEVTWAMYGPNPFIAKFMGIFINMNDLVGKDFEEGLENLKAIAESV